MSTRGPASAIDPEKTIYSQISDFIDACPFNRHIGLQLEKLGNEEVSLSLPWASQLIGNVQRQILHGGVFASVLDVAGAVACQNQLVRSAEHRSAQARSHNKGLSSGATVDLHVDYLRPGVGGQFYAKAHVLKQGAKLSNVRMELVNERGDLIAAGSGNYVHGKPSGRADLVSLTGDFG